MNTFPLAPFLYALAADGISVSFDDYDRISTVLSTGDEWTRARLRGVLLALLAHNTEQAERFQRRFDSFFQGPDGVEFTEEDIHGFLTRLRAITQKDPESAGLDSAETAAAPPADKPHGSTSVHRGSRWVRMLKRPLFWVVVISVLLAGGLTYRSLRKRKALTILPGATQPTQSPGSEGETKPGSKPGVNANVRQSSRIPNVEEFSGRIPLNVVDAVRRLPASHRWSDLLGSFGLVSFLFLLWTGLSVFVSRALKDPPPRFNPNSPRLFPFAALGQSLKPQLDGPTLDQLADSINYFLSTRPSKKLDINATIKATGHNAGMPDLCFHLQKQVRRVCIFEDSRSDALVWNKVTEELLEGLSKRGVDVLYGRFSSSPTQFLMRDGATYWLEDLDNERRDSLFLFFSDGKQVGNRRDIFALERLAKLPLVAWFDFREPKFWNETAYLIRTYGIPLYQANPDGLKRAFDRFLMESGAEKDDGDDISNWRGFPPFTDGQIAVYIEHLLGDSLVWAQACAMIQPLSLKLAHTLRRRFQPHLPAERIERLFRLPGTTWQASCLRFSQPILAALRGGFSTRISPDEQNTILEFIQQQIRLLEPPKSEKSLRRLAWEWTLRRVQLESAPDDVLPILSQLSQTPLGPEIKRDLSSLVFVNQPATSLPGGPRSPIPLRARPFTKKGMAYLKELSPQAEMSMNLSQSIFFSWQRLQFIITRVWRYAWQLQTLGRERVRSFLPFKTRMKLSVRKPLESVDEILAEPPELRIKRVFAGQTKTRSVTFKSYSGDWLAGTIVSDNEWLSVTPSYCDGQSDEKTIDVVVETSRLKPGDHAGNITFVPADNSARLDVPVSVTIYRSWKEIVVDWWHKHRPKHPVLASIGILALVSAVVFLTLKVLPGNWLNRIYNRPPLLNSIKARTNENLPDNMLELEAAAADADGDALQYEWGSDWGRVVVVGENPILVAGSGSTAIRTINLTLILKDASGGYSNYSTSIQMGEDRDRGHFSFGYDRRYSYSRYRSLLYAQNDDESFNYNPGSRGNSPFDYPSVDLLLANLKNGSPGQRWIAASSLAHVEIEKERIVPVLIDSLSDPDADVREAAITATMRFAPDSRIAVPRLVECLKTDRENVRIAAARALPAFVKDHEVTVPALLETLEDKSEAVATASADSLGNIGADAKAGLLELVSKNPIYWAVNTSRARRLAAAALARSTIGADPDSLSVLLGVLKDSNGDPEVRCGAAYAIAHLRPNDRQIITSLLPLMVDKDPRVRSAVVSAVWSVSSQGELDTSVVPALVKTLQDENAEVRRTAIAALTDISPGPEPDDWGTKLLEALKDRDAAVRHAAAAALAKRSDNSAIVAQLIALVQNRAFPRDGAAEALGLIKVTDASAAVQALTSSLADSDLELRRAAAYALSRLAAKNEDATKALIDYLSSPDLHLKNAAISAVWDIKARNLKQSALDSNEATVKKSLINALGDQATFVRSHAATALTSFGTSDPNVVSALENLVMNDQDGEVALSALESVTKAKGRLAICTDMPKFLNHHFADVRYYALSMLYYESYMCLGDRQGGGSELDARLREKLSDDDPFMRNGIIALGHNDGFPPVTTSVSELLRSPNFGVRISALRLLLYSDHWEAVRLLSRSLQDPDSRVRREAAFALGKRGDQRAEPYLQSALQDEDMRVKLAARCALVYLKFANDLDHFTEKDRDGLIETAIQGDTYIKNYAIQILESLDSYRSYQEFRRDRRSYSYYRDR